MTDAPPLFRVYDQQVSPPQIGEFRFLIQRRVATHSIDVWTTVAGCHGRDYAETILAALEAL